MPEGKCHALQLLPFRVPEIRRKIKTRHKQGQQTEDKNTRNVQFTRIYLWLPSWPSFILARTFQESLVHLVPYHEKHVFSGLYINWSSLSLPAPRVRKANNSCMVSAAHPLVKWRSHRLFSFQLLLLRNERSHLHWPASSAWWGGRPSPRWSLVCPAVS